MGVHPYQTPSRQPGEYWIVCASWSQSLAIQGKLHALVPHHRLQPGTTYSKQRGFGGRHPQVLVQHESGAYSVIRFKTTGQESLDLASATIDGALFDEPPKDVALFGEILQRVRARGGFVALTLTPIGADVAWLKDLVVQGVVSETHARLTPEALIPEGRTEPLRVRDVKGRLYRWDAEWVAVVRRLTPENERAIRCDGEWDVRVQGAYFGAVWNADTMVLDELPDVPVWADVGIDHGHRPGKQYACLLLIDDSDPADPVVYLADEYSDENGLSDVTVDARGILAMLGRGGWAWVDLRNVGGDRDHMPGTEHRKSNRDLEKAIAAQLGIPAAALKPRIRTVKRGAGRNWGSVEKGLRWIHTAMARGRFFVHRRCTRFLGAVPRFRLRKVDDEWKDIFDGVRYGLEQTVFGKPEQARTGVRIG